MNMQMQARLTGVTSLDFTPDGGEPIQFGELHILEPLDTRRGDAAGDRTSVLQCELAMAKQPGSTWKGPLDLVLELQPVTDRKGRRNQIVVGARTPQKAA